MYIFIYCIDYIDFPYSFYSYMYIYICFFMGTYNQKSFNFLKRTIFKHFIIFSYLCFQYLYLDFSNGTFKDGKIEI